MWTQQRPHFSLTISIALAGQPGGTPGPAAVDDPRALEARKDPSLAAWTLGGAIHGLECILKKSESKNLGGKTLIKKSHKSLVPHLREIDRILAIERST